MLMSRHLDSKYEVGVCTFPHETRKSTLTEVLQTMLLTNIDNDQISLTHDIGEELAVMGTALHYEVRSVWGALNDLGAAL